MEHRALIVLLLMGHICASVSPALTFRELVIYGGGQAEIRMGNPTNTSVSVRVDLLSHRTGQRIVQWFAAPPLSNTSANFSTRLVLLPGCNHVGTRLQGGNSLAAVYVTGVCNSTAVSARLPSIATQCALEDLADVDRFGAACVARERQPCDQQCCALVPSQCCNASVDPLVQSDLLSDFATPSYIGLGSNAWSLYPWVENVLPLESANDATSGSVVIAGESLQIACVSASVRCLMGLNASATRSIGIPVCTGSTTVIVALNYSVTPALAGSNYVATLAGHQITLNNSNTYALLATVAGSSTRLVSLSLSSSATACSPTVRLAVSQVRVETRCNTTAQFRNIPVDNCGVCGGPDYLLAQCRSGKSCMCSYSPIHTPSLAFHPILSLSSNQGTHASSICECVYMCAHVPLHRHGCRPLSSPSSVSVARAHTSLVAWRLRI